MDAWLVSMQGVEDDLYEKASWKLPMDLCQEYWFSADLRNKVSLKCHYSKLITYTVLAKYKDTLVTHYNQCIDAIAYFKLNFTNTL